MTAPIDVTVCGRALQLAGRNHPHDRRIDVIAERRDMPDRPEAERIRIVQGTPARVPLVPLIPALPPSDTHEIRAFVWIDSTGQPTVTRRPEPPPGWALLDEGWAPIGWITHPPRLDQGPDEDEQDYYSLFESRIPPDAEIRWASARLPMRARFTAALLGGGLQQWIVTGQMKDGIELSGYPEADRRVFLAWTVVLKMIRDADEHARRQLEQTAEPFRITDEQLRDLQPPSE